VPRNPFFRSSPHHFFPPSRRFPSLATAVCSSAAFSRISSPPFLPCVFFLFSRVRSPFLIPLRIDHMVLSAYFPMTLAGHARGILLTSCRLFPLYLTYRTIFSLSLSRHLFPFFVPVSPSALFLSRVSDWLDSAPPFPPFLFFSVAFHSIDDCAGGFVSLAIQLGRTFPSSRLQMRLFSFFYGPPFSPPSFSLFFFNSVPSKVSSSFFLRLRPFECVAFCNVPGLAAFLVFPYRSFPFLRFVRIFS